MSATDGGKADRRTSVAYGTVVVTAVLIAAKLTAFVTEAVLAAFLGTSATGDAYYMATGIQQVFYPMLSVGIWKVFLPEYKKSMVTQTQDQTNELANKTLFAFTAAAVVFSVALGVLAVPLTQVVAPGFDEQTTNLCAQIIRMTSPMYIAVTAAAVYAVMLQCHGKFFASQIREVVSHIPLIIAALFFFDRWGVAALAVGLLLGGVVRLIVELPFCTWGYRFKLDARLDDPRITNMAKRMPSALAAEAATQASVLVNRMIASTMGVGAVSVINYASKMRTACTGLLAAAVQTASYPRIAEYAASKQLDKLSTLLRRICCLTLFTLVPVSFAAFVLGRDAVSVLFERGAFDADATAATAAVFACYGAGFVFSSANELFNNVFYSFGRTRTAMVASVLMMVLSIAGSLALSQLLGVIGLPLATSASAAVVCVWQMWAARGLVDLQLRALGREAAVCCASSLVAVLVVALAMQCFEGALARLLVCAALFIAVYVGLTLVLRSDSARLLVERAKGVLHR